MQNKKSRTGARLFCLFNFFFVLFLAALGEPAALLALRVVLRVLFFLFDGENLDFNLAYSPVLDIENREAQVLVFDHVHLAVLREIAELLL